jgi:NDP-sugar pyrophosphorylase family protein/flavin reductase (DIM6/NTAB) family NADH-FMN oxidoreductase RutF
MASVLPEIQDESIEPVPSLANMKAVILAGGRGTRLAPYTSVLPKPLMPVGDRSILEIVVGQLEAAGIVNVNFCVGYLAHLIQAVFDNRDGGDATITYVREQDALGTAAPLRLVEGLDETFLVMNGDVLTTLDYAELVRFHRQQGNKVTIAAHKRSTKIDYGMLQLDLTQRVRGFREKPVIESPVSMGIYVMEPDVLDHIPDDEYFDFPDLIKGLLDKGERVGAYRFDGIWFDIGRQEDYTSAVETWLEAQNDVVSELTSRASGNGHSVRRNGNSKRNRNGHSDDGRAAVEAIFHVPPYGSSQRPHALEEPKRSEGVSLNAYTATFSQVPAAVSVVSTYAEDGRPHGTTVSAFSSLSVTPPLVMVALDRSSDLLKLLRTSSKFGLNVLAADQEEIGRGCARKGEDKFKGVSWEDDEGLPRIDGTAAWIACEVQEFIPGGDHLIVVGLVTRCEALEEAPLLYHRRNFSHLA